MRIIEKLPKKPNLDESLVRIITAFLFYSKKTADQYDYSARIKDPNTLLQILGNVAFLHNLVPEAKDLISAPQRSSKRNYTPHTTIISGGINPAYKENNEETAMVKQLYTANGKRDWNDVQTIPESKIIEKELYNAGIKNDGMILETKSTNIKENIVNAQKLRVYESSEHIKILTSAENAIRTRATARKVLGNTDKISIETYTPTIPNTQIGVSGIYDAQNFWALNEVSRRYVYGELLRVIDYSEKEEIILSDSDKNYVSLILKKMQENQK